ncbi:hypothetical protein [Hymenobacter rubripertinctus]|uniref:Uncharacterized protein n=1 Tax=Hymenobacter rubripertinctus TaxID=2029981 RepID=A0A418RAH1_9BACT|nr:hypothetical protein [Hymenobacter rubripertinctus]RIY14254.1 hypothetical protein D0T11_00795 [Hymenobacter rubripertinctus]
MPVRLAFYLLLILCGACQPTTFRQCPNPHTDPTKRLYNDIVTELIERRFYNAYLPEKEREELWRHFAEVDHAGSSGPNDSAWHQARNARLQNQLFQDSAHFQTFYLDISPTKSALRLAELPDSFPALRPWSDIVAMITALTPHQPQATLDRLNHVQTAMQAAEFQLCTARLRTLNNEQHQRESAARTITLSEVVFNARQDQALLSYGWRCGSRCGFGEVLLVEKTNGRWHIRQAVQTWIS